MGFPETLHEPDGTIELRRWSVDRLDDLMVAIEASLDDLRPWLPWADPMPTRAEEHDTVAGAIVQFDAGENFMCFIVERSTDDVVGCAGFHPKQGGVFEIGYWVRSDRHRQGYATQAASLLTEAARAHFPAATLVQIRTDEANAASAAIPPKIGFELQGREPWDRDLAPGESGIALIWTRPSSRPASTKSDAPAPVAQSRDATSDPRLDLRSASR